MLKPVKNSRYKLVLKSGSGWPFPGISAPRKLQQQRFIHLRVCSHGGGLCGQGRGSTRVQAEQCWDRPWADGAGFGLCFVFCSFHL